MHVGYKWKFDRYVNGHRLQQKYNVQQHTNHTKETAIHKFRCSECGDRFETRKDATGKFAECSVPPTGLIQRLRAAASRL